MYGVLASVSATCTYLLPRYPLCLSDCNALVLCLMPSVFMMVINNAAFAETCRSSYAKHGASCTRNVCCPPSTPSTVLYVCLGGSVICCPSVPPGLSYMYGVLASVSATCTYLLPRYPLCLSDCNALVLCLMPSVFMSTMPPMRAG